MKRKAFRIIITVIIFIVIIIIIFLNKVVNLNYIEIDKSDDALGIKTKISSQTTNKPYLKTLKIPPSTKYKNIALFGVDRRDKKSNSRSDLIMILTIDYTKKKVKISSLMRDLYIPIDKHGYTKLNHAYAYGGPQLALKTLNKNFGLNIREFCTVDFFNMEKIVDKIGGIKINIVGNEIKHLNNYLKELQNLENKKMKFVTKSGLQLLNGAQAVSYSRIRYTGNGDFDRTERQRTVLKLLIKKSKGMGLKDTINFLNMMFPCIETSFTKLQIFEIVSEYFRLQPIVIEEERFPIDGTWKSKKIKGIYYIQSDLSKIKKQLQAYICEDIKPSINDKY